jgi:hypothetical protein
MKKQLIVILMLGSLVGVKAKDKWSFAAELGVSSAQFSFVNYGYTRHMSPVIGGRVNYQLNKHISLISGLQFGSTKYHYNDYREQYNSFEKETMVHIETSKTSMTKLSIPLFINYQLKFIPFKPSFELGIRYNRFLSGNYSETVIYDRSSTPDVDDIRQKEVNLFSKDNYISMPVNTTQVHLGLQLQLSKQIGLNISRNMGSSYFVITEEPAPMSCIIDGIGNLDNRDFIVTLNYKFD